MPRFDRLEFDQPQEPYPEGLERPVDAERDERNGYRKQTTTVGAGCARTHCGITRGALELDRSIIGGWLGQVQMLIFLGEYPEAEGLWARKVLEIFRTRAT